MGSYIKFFLQIYELWQINYLFLLYRVLITAPIGRTYGNPELFLRLITYAKAFVCMVPIQSGVRVVSLQIPYIFARLDATASASIYYCFCAFLRWPYRWGHRVYANFSFQLCQHVKAHLFKVFAFSWLVGRPDRTCDDYNKF